MSSRPLYRTVAGLSGLAIMAQGLVILALASSARLAGATVWNQPERVTYNTIEDRTTSGSIVYPCYGEAYAVWMQEQDGAGWRIVAAERNVYGWSEPEPIDPGSHPDYAPNVGIGSDIRVVWQRGTGTAAEIVYAEGEVGGTWNVEVVTSNATEDLSPDLPLYRSFGEPKHIVWVGFDPESESGKIFYAADDGSGWRIERLDGSNLGPFWSGASPRIDANDNTGVVQIVYRGGDYGDYHLHHARKEGETWTYQVLASNNINDFSVDVWGRGGPVVVAMSGNDGWGYPSHVYIRRSQDGGVSFDPPELVSGGFSTVLANLTSGNRGLAIIGPEVSGNIYTGNLVYWLEGRSPELLPPLDMASDGPTTGQSGCIRSLESAGEESVLYTNTGGAGPDSAEVYFLATPGPNIAVEEGQSAPGPARLALRIIPNPFRHSARIDIEGLELAASGASVYDASGRLVRRLVAPRAGGVGNSHVFTWDGTAMGGQKVPAGIYMLRVDGLDQSRRLVRLP